jgi:hypothetical protein
MEKFRPYGLPDKQWLTELQQKLAARPGAKDRIVLPKAPPPEASSSDSGPAPDEADDDFSGGFPPDPKDITD